MKYLFINDIDYLINKKKKITLLIFLIPIIFLSIYLKTNINGFDLISRITGTNIDKNSYELIEIISYLFNVIILLYIVVNLYIKDIEGLLSNIFMRITPSKWYIKKTIGIIFLIFFIKTIEYSILFILTSNTSLKLFGEMILKDSIYNLFLECFFLSIYLIFIITMRNKTFPIIILLLLLINMENCILKISIIEYICLLLITNIFNCFIFNKYNKKIIENI